MELARELTRRADVLVENFKPETLERFGLGYDSLRIANPGLVHCSITGFGDGEGASLPGYDPLLQALSGLMSVTGPADGEPSKVGVAVIDVISRPERRDRDIWPPCGAGREAARASESRSTCSRVRWRR